MTDQHYILNDEGEPIKCDLMTWAFWLQNDREKRRVAVYEKGDVKVSTVFLGLDHNYGDGPPHIWETMVFGGEHDQEMDRCGGKRSEALLMHKAMLAKIGVTGDAP